MYQSMSLATDFGPFIKSNYLWEVKNLRKVKQIKLQLTLPDQAVYRQLFQKFAFL